MLVLLVGGLGARVITLRFEFSNQRGCELGVWNPLSGELNKRGIQRDRECVRDRECGAEGELGWARTNQY